MPYKWRCNGGSPYCIPGSTKASGPGSCSHQVNTNPAFQLQIQLPHPWGPQKVYGPGYGSCTHQEIVAGLHQDIALFDSAIPFGVFRSSANNHCILTFQLSFLFSVVRVWQRVCPVPGWLPLSQEKSYVQVEFTLTLLQPANFSVCKNQPPLNILRLVGFIVVLGTYSNFTADRVPSTKWLYSINLWL